MDIDNTKQIKVGVDIINFKPVDEFTNRELLSILNNSKINSNEQAHFYIDIKAEYGYRMLINEI